MKDSALRRSSTSTLVTTILKSLSFGYGIGELAEPDAPQGPERLTLRKWCFDRQCHSVRSSPASFQRNQVLGESLPRQRRAEPDDQPDMQLEQRLPIALVQFIQQAASEKRTRDRARLRQNFCLEKRRSALSNIFSAP